MGKLRSNLLSLLLLTALPSILFAAVPPTPNLAKAQNFSGPILVFWDPGGVPASDVRYYVFVSTLSMQGKTTSQLMADALVTLYPTNLSYSASKSSYEFRMMNPEREKPTYFRVVGVDPAANEWGSASNEEGATSHVERIFVQDAFTDVPNSTEKYKLDYDSNTVSFSFSFLGESDSPFLPPARVQIDIQYNGTSILAQTLEIPVTVNYSSSSFVATCATQTWDGAHQTQAHLGHKHNGMYEIVAIPLDGNNSPVSIGKMKLPIAVDVVHFNGGNIRYTTYGTTPNYGPPFGWNYYLSKNSFVTWSIWDRHQTADPLDDTLVKVVTLNVPRTMGDTINSFDGMPNQETWDGRNEQGLIVPNDVYRCVMETYEYWNEPGSGYNDDLTDRSYVVGTISFDVLRLVDIGSTGITDSSALARLKYTLGGANSAMGGATIKIAIATPGTTFYMAAGAGTASYLNGAASYSYVPGDPVPYDLGRLKKVFVFQRSAGVQSETWNGYDEAGNPLPNDNYVFAIAATDDSGNHAIDNSGNDRVIIGNVTIDRTAAQEAGDAVGPTVTAIAVDGTTILTGGGSTLTSPFSSIVIQMNDPGGSGVDLVNSTATLTGPTTNFIPLTATSNNIDTLTLTFGRQTTNGTYTLRLRPRDKVGNTASDTVCTFTLNAPTTGGTAQNAISFADSITAYPNPAKGAASLTFAYTAPAATTIKLEVYSILGELVYEEQWSTASGAQTKTWNIVNKAQNRLASGMYLYRLTDQNSASKPRKLRKLIIIQ